MCVYVFLGWEHFIFFLTSKRQTSAATGEVPSRVRDCFMNGWSRRGMPHTATHSHTRLHRHTQPSPTTHRHTQLYTATHCYTQPHTATSSCTKPHIATHSHTLLHTATHSHARPHTATHSHTAGTHESEQVFRIVAPYPKLPYLILHHYCKKHKTKTKQKTRDFKMGANLDNHIWALLWFSLCFL